MQCVFDRHNSTIKNFWMDLFYVHLFSVFFPLWRISVKRSARSVIFAEFLWKFRLAVIFSPCFVCTHGFWYISFVDKLTMSAAVHPRPLPTGMELMSGPITSGGVTRQQKEIEFVIDNIDGRLGSLKMDEKFQTYKALLFSVCVFSAMGGVTLILFGLHTTFFFNKYSGNVPALIFGGIFCSPMLYWFYYLFIPNKEEKRRRRKLQMDRMDRRKPTLFNQLVEEAKKATEPPPRRIRVLAHIRKHDYPIVASTMQELAEAIANQCGLAIERQLLRFNDNDLEIHLDKKLDVYYGLDDNSRVFVYNKGGFFTNDSPLKKARVADIMHMNDDLEKGPDGGGGGGRPSFNKGSSKNSFNSSINGLKSAMSDTDRRESFGSEKKKGNISWKGKS